MVFIVEISNIFSKMSEFARHNFFFSIIEIKYVISRDWDGPQRMTFNGFNLLMAHSPEAAISVLKSVKIMLECD